MTAYEWAKVLRSKHHPGWDALADVLEREHTQTAAAKRLGVSIAYLGDVLHERRYIAAIAGRLGFVVEEKWRKKASLT